MLCFDIPRHAGLRLTRTRKDAFFSVTATRPDLPSFGPNAGKYRNPIIFAKELQAKLIRDNLTRKQLAERHGISSDRITQWLCLLKLPEEIQADVTSLGDNWEKQMITERELRIKRKVIVSEAK